jgi:hypothetical protein
MKTINTVIEGDLNADAGIYIVRIELDNGDYAIKLGYSPDVMDRFVSSELQPLYIYKDNDKELLASFVTNTRTKLKHYELIPMFYPVNMMRILGVEIYNALDVLLPEYLYY